MKSRFVLAATVLCALAPLGLAIAGPSANMPAFYDAKLFTINFKELPSQGEQSQLTHNGSINVIYQSDPGLADGEMFVSVLDAIQGDGFNPLWREVQISFNPGFTAVQLYSDTQIDSAAAAGAITLSPTTEVYRCSVIGAGKTVGTGAKSASLHVTTGSRVRIANAGLPAATGWGRLRQAYSR